MARTPMVTRTIKTTVATVLCLNISDETTFQTEVRLPRTYKDTNHILKQVKQSIENDNIKAVHVIKHEEIEELYGMSEQRFIELAEVLPSRKTNK